MMENIQKDILIFKNKHFVLHTLVANIEKWLKFDKTIIISQEN